MSSCVAISLSKMLRQRITVRAVRVMHLSVFSFSAHSLINSVEKEMGCNCSHLSVEENDFLSSLREIPGINHSDISTALTLGQTLGSGQYSVVRAGTKKDGESVAVKCIELSRVGKTLRFLRRELDIMRHANHPNIVKYLGCYRDSKTIYITMERCASSLKEKMLLVGRLPEADVKKIARETISALSHLHELKIAHRDVKPENILLDANGAVKLVDFGLSRYLKTEKEITIVGTPYYLAPEVLQGVYSFECDMWSVGVVLYYALFGAVPFKADDSNMLFQRIASSKPSFPMEASQDCVSFIQLLLSKNPKRRMTPAQAFEHPWLASPS